MNQLSVETLRELPGVKVTTREKHYKPSPAVYRIEVHAVACDQVEEPEGFDIAVYYDENEAVEKVYIEALTSGDGWHTDTATFPNLRTFGELWEVCRLMNIRYPEGWPLN